MPIFLATDWRVRAWLNTVIFFHTMYGEPGYQSHLDPLHSRRTSMLSLRGRGLADWGMLPGRILEAFQPLHIPKRFPCPDMF